MNQINGNIIKLNEHFYYCVSLAFCNMVSYADASRHFLRYISYASEKRPELRLFSFMKIKQRRSLPLVLRCFNTLFHPEYVDLHEVVFTFHIERCDDCKPDQINLLTAGTDHYNG